MMMRHYHTAAICYSRTAIDVHSDSVDSHPAKGKERLYDDD
ncbi:MULTISPECIES: hypothetical protein [unclassified Klebsiella]|nr:MULTISPECIES: hypothetical protein [unclassified Klebsiella]